MPSLSMEDLLPSSTTLSSSTVSPRKHQSAAAAAASSWRSLARGATATVVGYAGALLILYFAHALVVPAESRLDFAPAQTCKAPPHACWDGWSKEHHGACTHIRNPTYIRGTLVEAGTDFCYKAVYFNIEPRSFAMAAWFVFWALLTTRTIERLVPYLFADQRKYARWFFVVALLLDIPSIWYSCSVMIHYLNDTFFDFYWSQFYYSITELFVYGVGVYLVDRRATPLPSAVVHCAIGTSIYHMLQLLVDERLLVFGGQTVRTIGRNFMFLGTDALFTLALVSVVRSGTGKAGAKARAVDWRIVGAAVFTNWAMFQLVFADFATIGLSQ